MSNLCNDNRFELVPKYKAELMESTNMEMSADEMAVLDNILFRMWQIGWLDRLEQPTVDAVEVVRCWKCKHRCGHMDGYTECDKTERIRIWHPDDWYCADGDRKDDGNM